MRPSDSLAPFGRGSGLPLPAAYPDVGACSSPPARAPTNTLCVGDGSPALRITGLLSGRDEGLPGYWVVLFVRAVVLHPAGYDPLLAHRTERSSSPSDFRASWASGMKSNFEAEPSRPTRLRAYASPARCRGSSQGSLPTWAGSPLAGRDSHSLDDRRSFMKSSHPPLLFDQHCLVAPENSISL